MADSDVSSRIRVWTMQLQNPRAMPDVTIEFLNACRSQPFARDAIKLQHLKDSFGLLLFTVNTKPFMEAAAQANQLAGEIRTRLLAN